MVAQLRITARHAKNLAVIRDIGKQRLTAVLECLRPLPKPSVSAKRFQRFIADTLEAEPDAAIRTRVLVGLDIVSRQYHITRDEIVESLSEGLKQHQWTDEQTARWNESADVLRAMLALETTRVVAKAIDLSFDYAHLLDNARIITDIRPVFDERHTAIIGAVVSHVLRISYFADDGPRSLSIAIDEADVTRLYKSCEEAQAKMKLSEELIKRNELDAITAGEESGEYRSR